jgi:hypothetical protein
MMSGTGEVKHTVVVIGSGFDGSMTALSIGRELRNRGQGETVHILERGTWWTTPTGTVQDIDVQTPDGLYDITAFGTEHRSNTSSRAQWVALVPDTQQRQCYLRITHLQEEN